MSEAFDEYCGHGNLGRYEIHPLRTRNSNCLTSDSAEIFEPPFSVAEGHPHSPRVAS